MNILVWGSRINTLINHLIMALKANGHNVLEFSDETEHVVMAFSSHFTPTIVAYFQMSGVPIIILTLDPSTPAPWVHLDNVYQLELVDNQAALSTKVDEILAQIQ